MHLLSLNLFCNVFINKTFAFLSRYAVAEEVQRGELEPFRIAGRPPLERNLHIARLARRPFTPSERGFVETLTRCCSKSEAYAADCVG